MNEGLEMGAHVAEMRDWSEYFSVKVNPEWFGEETLFSIIV